MLRQAEDGAIPLVAWQTRSGDAPALPAWNGEAKGVFLIDSQRLAWLTRTDDFMLIAARWQTVDEWNHGEAMKRRNDATPTRRLGPLATVAAGDPRGECGV